MHVLVAVTVILQMALHLRGRDDKGDGMLPALEWISKVPQYSVLIGEEPLAPQLAMPDRMALEFRTLRPDLSALQKFVLPLTKSNRAHVTICITVVPGYFLSYRVLSIAQHSQVPRKPQAEIDHKVSMRNFRRFLRSTSSNYCNSGISLASGPRSGHPNGKHRGLRQAPQPGVDDYTHMSFSESFPARVMETGLFLAPPSHDGCYIPAGSTVIPNTWYIPPRWLPFFNNCDDS
ncbi:hypothetical protein V8E53_012182 [Lactarius tabidus]